MIIRLRQFIRDPTAPVQRLTLTPGVQAVMARRYPLSPREGHAMDPAWKRLHRIADSGIVLVQDAVVAAVRIVRRGLDQPALAAAIAARDEATVLRLVDWAGVATPQLTDGLTPEITRLFGAAGEAAAEDLGRQLAELPPEQQALGAELTFDLLNPHAVAWIEARAGTLITEIDAGQRLAIRDLLLRSFVDGIPPAATARLMRATIGLTSRQGQAIVTYRQRLVEQGLGEAAIFRRVDRYYVQLLRYRTETIARTETIMAANAGQQELWLQARDAGFLPEDRTRRHWIVTPDDRLDHRICAPMPGLNPEGVGLEEPFRTGGGGTVMHPPAHPRCRCAMGLQFAPRPVTPKPPRAPRRPRPPTPVAPERSPFAQRVQDAIGPGLRDEQHAVQVGQLVQAEWERRYSIEHTRRRLEWQARGRSYQGALRQVRSFVDEPLAQRQARDALYDAMLAAEVDLDRFVETGYHTLLGEIRPLGGELRWKRGNDRHVQALVDDVSRLVPRAWIERSNAYGPLGARQLEEAGGGAVGQYQPGPGRIEVLLQGREHPSDARMTALHELNHRMEHTTPRLVELEAQFFARRTAGERHGQIPAYAEGTRGRVDQFVVPYMGRDYRRDGRGRANFYEILSMGSEGVLLNAYEVRRDLDMLHFILGLYAGV